MKLYYSPGACSLADHIVLEWIGQPYQTQRVSREDRRSPAYLAINPAGAVPALEDEGWVLTQNSAILHYLTDRFPQSGLDGGSEPRARAEVNRWLAFVNSDVHPAFKPLFGATAYLEDDAAIGRSKANARGQLRGLFARLDAQLAERDWIAGSRSIADPYLYVVTRWAKANEVDLSGFDHLERHFRRMGEDAAVRKVLADEGLS